MSKVNYWTPEEDKILLSGLEQGLTFDQISEQIEARDATSCRNRYYKHLKNNKKITLKKPWTAEEDKVLKDLIDKHSECFEDAFSAASKKLGRTKLACRSRWYQHVSESSLENGEDPVIIVSTRKHMILNRRYPSRPSLTTKKNAAWYKKVVNFFLFSKKKK